MRTLPLVVLVVSVLALTGCSTPSSHHREYRQAARPAPAPGPLIVQQPPSYPGTTYTPPGTGLPMPGQPGQKPAVPRSPNTRVLPASNEPGLWAADGAPHAALAEPTIYGITIPFPPLATKEDKALVGFCAGHINDVSKKGHVTDFVNTHYPESVRRCLAFSVFEHCAENMKAGVAMIERHGLMTGGQGRKTARRVASHAKRFAETGCDGVTLDDDQKKIIAKVRLMWDAKIRQDPWTY